MKKFAIVLCLALIAFAPAAADTLELVTLQYPPYEFEENGEVKGVAIDIINEVFSKMKQPISIKVLPWARAIGMIKSGNADAIFTAYKTAERETFADYSKEVLMPQTISLFVLKESNVAFDGDLSKLGSNSFGVVRKVSYGKSFDGAVKAGTISKVDESKTGVANMEKLLKGRFDILISNKYGAVQIMNDLGKADMIKELAPEVQSVPSYIAFSKKRNRAGIRDKFDVILADMKKTGAFDKIIDSYFKK